jgi:hypothetical protein
LYKKYQQAKKKRKMLKNTWKCEKGEEKEREKEMLKEKCL